MSLAIYTLGCRLNFAESEELFNLLTSQAKNSFKNKSLVIVRGCSVTKKAEKETKFKIKELRQKFPNFPIIAAGCVTAQFTSPDANLIIPKLKEKNLLKEIKKLRIKVKKNFRSSFSVPDFKRHTRSFIKIQDGCENYCAYCLVPYLRGKEKSRSFKEILGLIQEKEKQGYQEIVLTGVNIGEWQEESRIMNYESRIRDLVWLIRRILKETSIPRIRISSLWPDVLSPRFLKLFQNSRLGRHLHLSLQSLSSSVLKRMNRHYKVKEIKEKIKKTRRHFPDLTLTADIIVGFPGETEKEFQETVKGIKEINLSKIHVFRYSPRPGTAAAFMKNQVNNKIKKTRAKTLLLLNEKLNKKWRQKFIGQTREVLFEQRKNDFRTGFTDNYLKVFVKSNQDLANQILPVRLERLYRDGIIGKL